MQNSDNHRYFIIYKPYGVLSQFTDSEGRATLSGLFSFPADVYPVGRLDYDSEGLLILTNDKKLNNLLLNPVRQHKRTYLVQVEGILSNEAAKLIEKGVQINVGGKLYNSLPASAKIIQEPDDLPERIPPIRFRKNIPTSWLELTPIEGKNRQVRKMTAAVGFPTLRLIRTAIEDLKLQELKPGYVEEVKMGIIYKLLKL